jgi:hypothetical protein
VGVLDPFRFVLISIAGWMNQQPQQALDYLREENRVLREQFGGNLGYSLARGTVANILKRHDIEPVPERTRKTTRKEFLTQHWDMIVAADFFTIEVWRARGLQRFVVLFFIELSTRRVEIAGTSAAPNDVWINQIARNLTDTIDGLLTGKRYLVHDRDPLFTDQFLSTL